jgi:cysteinyl-tRNA synthetase
MTIRIQDTLTGDKREFVPVTPGKVGMYLCGMTVQDKPHVGHMRSAIVGDVIRRYLEHAGFEVTFLYNFTDIDDKIIERGNDEGVQFEEVSERNINAFLNASKALGVMPASVYPRATAHIAEIIDLIKTLEERGLAYAQAGDVYFRVRKFEGYGKLSGRRVEELESGARIAVGEHKEDPLDFTLWKGAKPGEPSWESPWGNGRPGWHIECSAMSCKYLGETFDIHAGGLDLVFPHHENEIAQSEGAHGKPFANYWVHNGMVNLGGEKMSKSTEHFFLAEDILAECDPHVVRFYLLSTHYRSPIEFSRERLAEAEGAYTRLVSAAAAADALDGDAANADAEAREFHVGRLVAAFENSMADDFNTAKAQGHLFELAREINRAVAAGDDDPAKAGLAKAAGEELRRLSGVLGIELVALAEVETDVPAEVQGWFEAREAARTAKDWALADELRDKIQAAGFTIKDGPEGSKVVPA